LKMGPICCPKSSILNYQATKTLDNGTDSLVPICRVQIITNAQNTHHMDL